MSADKDGGLGVGRGAIVIDVGVWGGKHVGYGPLRGRGGGGLAFSVGEGLFRFQIKVGE